VVVTPVPPAKVRVSVPTVTTSLVVPSDTVKAAELEIVAVETAVIKPLAFTVIIGTDDAPPKLPVFELTVARVPAAVTLPLPSKLGLV